MRDRMSLAACFCCQALKPAVRSCSPVTGNVSCCWHCISATDSILAIYFDQQITLVQTEVSKAQHGATKHGVAGGCNMQTIAGGVIHGHVSKLSNTVQQNEQTSHSRSNSTVPQWSSSQGLFDTSICDHHTGALPAHLPCTVDISAAPPPRLFKRSMPFEQYVVSNYWRRTAAAYEWDNQLHSFTRPHLIACAV